MRIELLSLTNIKCFSSYVAQFAPGINFICGKNGAGKTTLVEAIGLALFNTGSEEKRYVEYFLRDGAKSGEIRLCFSVGDERYTIVRRLRRSGTQRRLLDAEGNELDLHGDQDIDDFLRETLGLSPKQSLAKLYNEVVGVRQGMLTQPFRETASERKRIFNGMLGVERYKQAAQKMPELSSLIQQKAEDLRTRYSICLSHTEDLPACREGFKLAAERLAAAQEALAAAQKRCQEGEAKLEILLKQQEALTKLETALTEATARYTEQQRQYTVSIEQDTEALKNAREKLLAMEASSLRGKAGEAERIQNEEQAKTALEQFFLQAETERTALQADITALLQQQAAQKAGLAELQDTASRSEDGNCPFLNMPCTSVASLAQAIKERMDKAEAALADTKERLHTAQILQKERLHALQKGESAKKAAHQQAQEALFSHRSKQAGLHDLIENQKEQIRHLEERMAKLQLQQQSLTEQQAAIAALTEQKAALQIDPDACRQAQVTLAQLHAELGRAKGDESALLQETQRLEGDVARKEAMLQEQQALEKQLQHMQALQALSADIAGMLRGAGERVGAVYRERLGLNAARFYQDISGQPVRLSWTEDYDIQLEDSHLGDTRTRCFRQLSGGEQVSAALSIRLALLKQLSSLGIAVFDEPTSNLDSGRRESLAKLLPRVTAGFDQVFVISHDDTFDSVSDTVLELG